MVKLYRNYLIDGRAHSSTLSSTFNFMAFTNATCQPRPRHPDVASSVSHLSQLGGRAMSSYFKIAGC